MAVQTIPQEKKKLVLLEPLYFRASLLQQLGLYRHTAPEPDCRARLPLARPPPRLRAHLDQWPLVGLVE